MYRDRIVAERDNCRAAITWAMASDDWETAIRLAGALWRTWWPSHAIGGKAWTENVEEGLTWIERTLPHRGDLPVRVIAEALIGAGVLNNMLGRIPESEAHLRMNCCTLEEKHLPLRRILGVFPARCWRQRAMISTARAPG